MSLTVMRGQKTDLTKRSPGITEVIVGIGWETSKTGIEIDGAAFMLQGNGKCRGDEDFIFYGNPSGRNGAVTVQNAKSPDKAQININLRTVPGDVERIAFTLTIYEGPHRGHNFGQVPGSYIRVATPGNEDLIRFDMGRDFNAETAIVVAELYRHNGEWKFNPIAMGYQGGLAVLCGSFGIVVSDSPTNQPSQVQAAPTIERKPQPKPVPPQPKISLSKIELKKKGDKINLEKKANNRLGEILINLNWSRKPVNQGGGGFFGSIFGSGNKGIDLDLGCMVETKDGRKTVVQALDNDFGDFDFWPFVSLDGDDRTGEVSTGENLRINGNKIPEIKRILVFAFIYEGVTNWAHADGVVTLKQPGGPDIVVKLDEHDNRKSMCAIAMIENVKNETLSIERLVQYFPGHEEMDRHFGFGFRWVVGSKD